MRHSDVGGGTEMCWGWPWSAGFLMNGFAVRGWDVQTDITVLVCIWCTCDTGLCGNYMPVVHMGVWGHIFLFLRVFTAVFGPHTSQVFVCFCTGCTCGCLSMCIQLRGKKIKTLSPINMDLTYKDTSKWNVLAIVTNITKQICEQPVLLLILF